MDYLAICPLPLLAPFGFFIDPSRHKWLFYFDRFNNHEISAKLDQALCEATEEKMVEVQEASDLSWIEVGPRVPWLPRDLIVNSFAVQVYATCRGCTDAVPSHTQMELYDGVLPCTR